MLLKIGSADMPRQYAPKLRCRVIDLIEGGRSVSEVAAMVEPTEQTICNWWNCHLVDTGRKTGTPTIENWDLAQKPGDLLAIEPLQ